MMWEIAFRSFQEDTVGDQDLEDAGVGVAAGVVAVDVDAVENRSVPRKKVTGDEKEEHCHHGTEIAVAVAVVDVDVATP
jgi:hypothetical protein